MYRECYWGRGSGRGGGERGDGRTLGRILTAEEDGSGRRSISGVQEVLTGEEQATLNATPSGQTPDFKPPTTTNAQPLTPLETPISLHF